MFKDEFIRKHRIIENNVEKESIYIYNDNEKRIKYQ